MVVSGTSTSRTGETLKRGSKYVTFVITSFMGEVSNLAVKIRDLVIVTGVSQGLYVLLISDNR